LKPGDIIWADELEASVVSLSKRKDFDRLREELSKEGSGESDVSQEGQDNDPLSEWGEGESVYAIEVLDVLDGYRLKYLNLDNEEEGILSIAEDAEIVESAADEEERLLSREEAEIKKGDVFWINDIRSPGRLLKQTL